MLLLLQLYKAGAQSYVFAQLTGAPVNTTGWNLTGNAYAGNTPIGAGNSEIILTDPFNSQSGAIFFTSPINIVQCNKWTVDFEFRMFDGSAADGIAFCLLDVPPSGFVGGGGVGIPAASNGLKIVFDSFDNCGAPNPAIQIRYGAGYAGGECNMSQPTLDNNSGNLSFLRSNGYNTARVEYDAGNIDVYVNGTQYLSGFYNINFTTYAGFTASTGGANDRHSIRNVVIRTDRAQPTAYSGPNATTCSNQPIQIGTAPNPNYQYQWIPATGLDNPTIGNPTLTLTNNGTTPQIIKYKVGANIVGTTCVAYDSVYVTVNPIPNADFIANAAQYCVNQNATLTYSGWAPNTATYNWNFDGGTVVSGSGQGPYVVNWATAGTKNITLDVTLNGCTSTIYTLQIPVYNYPSSAFTINPTAVCPNVDAAITYTAAPSGTATYTWSFNGGTVSSGSGAGPYNVNWATPGNKTVTLTVTDNGCQSTLTQEDILIYTIPTANFSAVSPVCENQPATIAYQGTGTAAATYTWNWDGGATTALGNESYDVSWPFAGLKTVTLTVTENGCQSTLVSQNVTVNAIPSAEFTITPAVCRGQDAQAAYNGVPSPTALYNWNWNGGNTSPITGQSYNVNWDIAGIYPVTLIVTENGCQSAPAVHAVTVEFQPLADFNFLPAACINKPLDITFSGTAPQTSQYTWVLSNGGVLGGAGTEINGTWPVAGNPDVTLTVTEGNCSSTITKQVNITPPPKPNLAVSYNICLGEELNLDPGNYVSYLWEDGDDNRLHNVSLAGLYTVTVVDENGCEGSGQTTVTDTTCLTLYIPNAFTPNGDHHNDLFMPMAEFPIDYHLWIYNRWGELMFTSTNPSQPWDGEVNGKQCLPDIYVYKLEFSGFESERIIKGSRKGTIALIR